MAVAAALGILLAVRELHAALGAVVTIGFCFVVDELLLAWHRCPPVARGRLALWAGANTNRPLLIEFGCSHQRPRSTVDSAAVYGTANEGPIPSEVTVVRLLVCNFLVHVPSCVHGSSRIGRRICRSQPRSSPMRIRSAPVG